MKGEAVLTCDVGDEAGEEKKKKKRSREFRKTTIRQAKSPCDEAQQNSPCCSSCRKFTTLLIQERLPDRVPLCRMWSDFLSLIGARWLRGLTRPTASGGREFESRKGLSECWAHLSPGGQALRSGLEQLECQMRFLYIYIFLYLF